MVGKLELISERVGLCIVDVQEKLAATMPEKVLKGTLRNWLNLIETARVMRLAVAVSAQSPKVMGRSLPVVAESVLRLPREEVLLFEKQRFSCVTTPEFLAWAKRVGKDQWIVAGMETHVAVYQTVRDLVAAGHTVHVPRDAVISRTMANWEIGLSLAQQSGGIVTSTEAVIFDLLKEGSSENFAALSRVIK
ncbi:MAG: isochorismatase family protein [Deltaproteobacteria bacterium]|nr:isochorismatase family protein [Deltaproteobacteria bacterium]